MTIKNGELADADEVMNALGSLFNDTAQNIFNADYIGFDSKLSNTGVPSYDNVSYSIFTSDDADVNSNFLYDSADDLYICPDLSGITEYVIIEATSFGTWTNGDNDTYVLQIADTKWLVYCDTGTDEVQRAQIHKSLWYGTGGSNQLILDFTTVTAVKTSDSDDEGKQAHYAYGGWMGHNTNNYMGTYTGTFVNTSTNANCSSWSMCKDLQSTYNEIGTDRTGDEVNNPATCQIDYDGIVRWEISGTTRNQSNGGNSGGHQVQAVILCEGDITWSISAGVALEPTLGDIDFKTDHSIPDMTEAGSLVSEGVGVSTLIFKDTVTSTNNAIAVINSTIDATSSEQISISADGGSNWTDVNNAEIARPTAGTALWRRIVISRTDFSKEDKVTEQAVKYNLY